MIARCCCCLSLIVSFFAPNLTTAEVRTPAVFGNGMVIQQQAEVPVWGWADAGEQVTVSFRDQTVSATADDSGRWQVKLQALELGPAAKLSVKGSNEIVFDDVLVGEVWVCSGQSNMVMSVQRALDADLEIAAADFPQIRLFKVPQVAADQPQQDVNAHWEHCSPETVANFSAVGHYFGRQLQQTLDVPVGLIMTCWGGTRAEAWTSHEAITSVEELQPIVDTWNRRTETYDPNKAQSDYEAALEKWTQRVRAARKAGRPVPRKPALTGPPQLDRHHFSTLYNGMVAPLIPYAIRGAIWYQGEGNSTRSYQYRTLMPTLIQSWRDAWDQGDFPFYQVQLANFRAIAEQPQESAWAELREAQAMAKAALPNVDAVCITDLGAAKDIHPKDKQGVASRLARLALVDLYGFDSIVRQGPTFRKMTVDGDRAIISFETYGSALTAYYQQPLTGFAIADENRVWRWANAKIIDSETVEVSHPDVTQPTAVRYNWAENPQGTLYNAAYLPAYPFRTDDWPGITQDKVTP